MRVGIVCPYSFDVPGGVQYHVRDLAEYLLAANHEVSVLAPAEEGTTLPPYGQPLARRGQLRRAPYSRTGDPECRGARLVGRKRADRRNISHLESALPGDASGLSIAAALTRKDRWPHRRLRGRAAHRHEPPRRRRGRHPQRRERRPLWLGYADPGLAGERDGARLRVPPQRR